MRIFHKLAKIASVVSLFAIQGCASTLQSEDAYADASHLLTDYRLAQTEINVSFKQLSTEKAGPPKVKTILAYAIEVSLPKYSGDLDQVYYLEYAPSASSNDNLTVKVDPIERLLEVVNLKAEGQLDDVIVEIAESASLVLESAPAKGTAREEELLSVWIDPTDTSAPASLLADMNRFGAAPVSNFDITRQTLPPARQPTSVDCGKGICYRLPERYTISFEFSNGRKFEKFISLPTGPIVAIPISGSEAVEKVHNIKFSESGVPTEVTVQKPSEALAWASRPLDVAKALLSVPAELLQLKVDISDKEKALIESRAALEKAKLEAASDDDPFGLNAESSPGRSSSSNTVFMFGASDYWGAPPAQTGPARPPAPAPVAPAPTPGAGSPGAGPKKPGGGS